MTNKIDDIIKLDQRIAIRKGWGSLSGEANRGKFVDRNGNDLRVDDLVKKIGEVFIYHKEDEETLKPETVKALYIEKDKILSTHFHLCKTEIFFAVFGAIEVEIIWDGISEKKILKMGDSMLVSPGVVHSMKGLEDNNILIEVSTLDHAKDSYRIKKGD